MNPFFTDSHPNRDTFFKQRGEASSRSLNTHHHFQPLQPKGQKVSTPAESSAFNGLWASLLMGMEGALFSLMWNGCHYQGSLHFMEATWVAVLISVTCFFAMMGYGLGIVA